MSLSFFFRFMNLACVGPTQFQNTQHYFVVPAIEQHWADVQAANLAKYKDQSVVVAGNMKFAVS